MSNLSLKGFVVAACILVLAAPCEASGRPHNEVPLSGAENAYNPIPNAGGTLIAYVRTGWGRPGGTGGFGRSNLVSEVMLMDASGRVASDRPLADAFLY